MSEVPGPPQGGAEPTDVRRVADPFERPLLVAGSGLAMGSGELLTVAVQAGVHLEASAPPR